MAACGEDIRAFSPIPAADETGKREQVNCL
jgi:hypothetical protein